MKLFFITLSLDVRVENETVWLNRNQIALLFDRDVKTIGKHINNALKEELDGLSTVANFATVQTEGSRSVTRNIDYYNLDVILSVGYRVKSKRGIQFRQWANKVLKEYLLRGYSVNQRLLYMENRIDRRLLEHDKRLDDLTDKVDFFIRASLPPKEGVFFNGQIFDAHEFICRLIKSANNRIVAPDCVLAQTAAAESSTSLFIWLSPQSPQTIEVTTPPCECPTSDMFFVTGRLRTYEMTHIKSSISLRTVMFWNSPSLCPQPLKS